MQGLRRFIFTSSSGRAACILWFLVFLFLCGLHVAGIHHDVDSHSLGLINGLSAFIIFVALMAVLVPLSSTNRFSRRPPLRLISMPSATVHRLIPSCPEVLLRR